MAFGNNTAEIKAVITARDDASKVLGKFGSTVKSTARQVGIAITAAAAAAVAFGVSSVKAYEESQNVLTQLNTVLKSTKSIAGVTADAAVDLSKALQQTTKFSDEEVLSAENLLLTFTKIGKDIFPQATETVLDMATALGEDTKSASIQLGKALQDPILGITALRRVGVNFNDAQKEVIKKLVETGHAAEAQKLILKELHTEFGGSAKAAGTTFAGQVAKLKNTFNDLQESIGYALVKAVNPYVAKISSYIKNAGPKFQEQVASLIMSFLKFGGFLIKHIDIIIALIAAYKTLKITMAITSLIQGLTAAFTVNAAAMGATGAAATTLSLGPLALVAGAAAAVGFGVFKLIQHFKNTVIAMGEVKQGTETLNGAWNVNRLFVEANTKAHKDLIQAKKDLKIATDENKKAQDAFAKAAADSKTPESKLFDLEHNAIQSTIKLGVARGTLATNTENAAQAHKDLLKWQKAWNDYESGKLGVVATLNTNMSKLAVNTLQVTRGLNYIQGQPKDIQLQFQNALPKTLLQGSGTNLQGGTVPLQGTRAAGGPTMGGSSYLVGEHGPELFTPTTGGKITPSEKVGGGQTINITIQAGAYMGSQQDARRYAQMIINAMSDIASSKNKSVNQLLGIA